MDEEKELMIQNALKSDPDLEKRKKIFADTLRLVEKSCNESIPELTDGDWKLSESRKEKIFAEETPDLPESENELNDHSTDKKQSINLLFWIPLGVAACAFLIVMVSETNKPNQTESVAIALMDDQTRETKDLIKGKEDLVPEENSELNQMLQNKAQEGANLALVKRTTTEVLAMNEELKQVPSLAEAFASRDSSLSPKMLETDKAIKKMDDRGVEQSMNFRSLPSKVEGEPRLQTLAMSKSKQKDETSSPFALNDRIEDKDSLAWSRTNQTDAIPIPTSASEQVEAEEGSIVFKSESDTLTYGISSELIETGDPIPELAKASSTLVAENNQNQQKKNGYDLIDRSKSVYLFTPKAKALGKVKIVNRAGPKIELLRLHETRLGKSALLRGEGYQLRFSYDDEPVIILVGNLRRNEVDQEDRDPKNLNELSSYFFEITESWELDEKEIRKPYNLNNPR
ncbi:MAG: hypothetical protein ACJZ64_04055 [Opitutales bacterium]